MLELPSRTGQDCPGEHPYCPPTLALTILVKEEEEEGVYDGDEDPTPERDAAGWQGHGIRCTPLGGAGPRGSPGGCRGAAHWPAESRLKAMAVPITSCMSEVMMAISIISQSKTRGT